LNIAKEVAAMERMTVDQLRDKFADVFGEAPRSRHKEWLIKRVAWRMQANVEGDLSERARRRAAELANDADLRVTAPREPQVAPTVVKRKATKAPEPVADADGLMPGMKLTRKYKGKLIQVEVKRKGILYDGEIYPSLSAVAKAVTGSHWSGHRFFGIQKRGAA
jgi:hypothetical protein